MHDEAKERARSLLALMTIEEKAQQLTAIEPYAILNTGLPTTEQLSALLENGIGHIAMFSMFQHQTPQEHAQTVNTVQRYLVEETRLGIPAIFHLEALNGIVAPDHTVFPTGIALASTWDPVKVEQMASISARQARALGYSHALSPVMDVARDARWGRVHETYGEDPHLVSEFSVAFTRGMQGDDLSRGVMATGKHFLGFAMSEGGQHMAATAVGARELREVYARPFEAAIRAGLGSVMNSYSTIDGVPVGSSRQILTDLLRGELGFDGTVVADYGTIGNLVVRQEVASDLTQAALLALDAGLDVELPSPAAYGANLAEAVRAGHVSEELLDRSVLRVLRDKFALGLFESPYADISLAGEDARDGAQLAHDLARESVVLLSNGSGKLPLAPSRKIAVIGPHAASRGVAFPAYTYFGALGLLGAVDRGDTVKMAGVGEASGMPKRAREALNTQLAPHLSQGFEAYAAEHYGAESLAEALERLDPFATISSFPGCDVLEGDSNDLQEAADAAYTADVVILALGGRAGWFGEAQTEGEGSDQANIDLPATQMDLVRRVVATGTPTVAVVFTGRPFALTELDGLVDTIVHAPYGGQSGVAAVAEALMGVYNPSGRLPISLPRHSGQVPIHSGQHVGSGYRRTAADMHIGYNDLSSRPLYAFGHGLGYSTFDYSDFTADPRVSTNGTVRARVTVSNEGDRDGVEVVQFYASHPAPGITRPAQQLVGFARVELAAGESRLVEIEVSTGQLAYLNGNGRFIFDPTVLDLQVGRAADDIRSRADVEVVGETADWSTARPLHAQIAVSERQA